MSGDSSRISPTAHYTSYVWFRAGLSHPALTSSLGRALHLALAPMNLAYDHLSDSPSLDMMLLARHRVLDHLLAQEIEAGRVRQVVEVAAGLSPRGFSFARRYESIGLRYIEADLPDMAATKRDRLDGAGLRGSGHLVVELDALTDDGPSSLPAIAARHLDPNLGVAIITEGLIGYFDLPSVENMWQRFARVLRGFPHGLYLSDLNMGADLGGMRGARLFQKILSTFARGQVHMHFAHPDEATAALSRAGFARTVLHAPTDVQGVDVPGRGRRHAVRLIEAHV